MFHVTDTDTDSAVGSLVVSRVAADANANANARRRSAPLRAAAAWSSRRFIAGNKQARTSSLSRTLFHRVGRGKPEYSRRSVIVMVMVGLSKCQDNEAAGI